MGKVTPKILIVYSMAHTGSQFLRSLFSAHPKISSPIQDWYLATEPVEGSQLFINNGSSLETVLDKGFIETCQKYVENEEYEYLFVFGYVHMDWLTPFVLYRPFEFKLVSPIRHPYKVMQSAVFRNETNSISLGQYLNLIYILKNIVKDYALVPVDIIADSEPDIRLQKMTDVFNYLGLDITPEIKEMIHQWKPIGVTNPKDVETTLTYPNGRLIDGKLSLLPEEKERIEKRIRNTMILDKLREIGIDYG